MNKLYLLLGSNMGDSKKQLKIAAKHIEKNIGKITRQSHYYQTAAWGKKDQPDFLNQIVILETRLAAEITIKEILQIEADMGRLRTEKNAPRIIDIDILYFNKEKINLPQLQVPHPRIQNRRFVLIPLNELSPNFVHPVLQKNNHELLKICKDKLDVKKI
ncbi:MAG: 2-amino-4-hydroxy-6-hydroxymethyldihydropteridine diphosphokinase [Sphingobacteriales bacterium]|nr:MAG: 2-amino-4-hydroxy-6-hydroxymethyldihydropteridine diphosphokinase [Sphingobacteriales bacterium]